VKAKWKLLMSLLLGIITSGCCLITFIGDRLSYRFSGRIIASLDGKAVPAVQIVASCIKTRLDPPLEIFSDNDGKFLMQGYFWGALDDCQLSFYHQRFKSKVIKLEPARDLTEDTGFIKVWVLEVELAPL